MNALPSSPAEHLSPEEQNDKLVTSSAIHGTRKEIQSRLDALFERADSPEKEAAAFLRTYHDYTPGSFILTGILEHTGEQIMSPEALRILLDHEDPHVRGFALISLMERGDVEARSDLVAVLEKEEAGSEPYILALEYADGYRDPEMTALLIAQREKGLSTTLIHALGTRREPEVGHALLDIATTAPKNIIQRLALKYLGAFETPEVDAVLLDALAQEESIPERIAALYALQTRTTLSPALQEAVITLMEEAEDPDLLRRIADTLYAHRSIPEMYNALHRLASSGAPYLGGAESPAGYAKGYLS